MPAPVAKPPRRRPLPYWSFFALLAVAAVVSVLLVTRFHPNRLRPSALDELTDKIARERPDLHITPVCPTCPDMRDGFYLHREPLTPDEVMYRARIGPHYRNRWSGIVRVRPRESLAPIEKADPYFHLVGPFEIYGDPALIAETMAR
jgi:hypothetical protein